ncbi:uncharacterized protein [Paralichthys olivaceus]|uniref:uncharacterized protein isoform X2 n=1 Tax=Paralichthys olivaceus TaxID=8255 RepID=UPI0037515C0D
MKKSVLPPVDSKTTTPVHFLDAHAPFPRSIWIHPHAPYDDYDCVCKTICSRATEEDCAGGQRPPETLQFEDPAPLESMQSHRAEEQQKVTDDLGPKHQTEFTPPRPYLLDRRHPHVAEPARVLSPVMEPEIKPDQGETEKKRKEGKRGKIKIKYIPLQLCDNTTIPWVKPEVPKQREDYELEADFPPLVPAMVLLPPVPPIQRRMDKLPDEVSICNNQPLTTGTDGSGVNVRTWSSVVKQSTRQTAAPQENARPCTFQQIDPNNRASGTDGAGVNARTWSSVVKQSTRQTAAPQENARPRTFQQIDPNNRASVAGTDGAGVNVRTWSSVVKQSMRQEAAPQENARPHTFQQIDPNNRASARFCGPTIPVRPAHAQRHGAPAHRANSPPGFRYRFPFKQRGGKSSKHK